MLSMLLYVQSYIVLLYSIYLAWLFGSRNLLRQNNYTYQYNDPLNYPAHHLFGWICSALPGESRGLMCIMYLIKLLGCLKRKYSTLQGKVPYRYNTLHTLQVHYVTGRYNTLQITGTVHRYTLQYITGTVHYRYSTLQYITDTVHYIHYRYITLQVGTGTVHYRYITDSVVTMYQVNKSK